jgi:hypothetical protein
MSTQAPRVDLIPSDKNYIEYLEELAHGLSDRRSHAEELLKMI